MIDNVLCGRLCPLLDPVPGTVDQPGAGPVGGIGSETKREVRRSRRIHDILWQLSETGEHP